MFKHFRARSMRALSLSAALIISACAGTKVADVNSSSAVVGPALPRTVAVMVENDSTPPRKEKHRAKQLADAQQASAALEAGLSQVLAERHLVVVSETQRPDLILRCNILDVRGGNTALRVIFGYGAGKAILKVRMTLVDTAAPSQPLLAFDVNSTTGRAPGALWWTCLGQRRRRRRRRVGCAWPHEAGFGEGTHQDHRASGRSARKVLCGAEVAVYEAGPAARSGLETNVVRLRSRLVDEAARTRTRSNDCAMAGSNGRAATGASARAWRVRADGRQTSATEPGFDFWRECRSGYASASVRVDTASTGADF